MFSKKPCGPTLFEAIEFRTLAWTSPKKPMKASPCCSNLSVMPSSVASPIALFGMFSISSKVKGYRLLTAPSHSRYIGTFQGHFKKGVRLFLNALCTCIAVFCPARSLYWVDYRVRMTMFVLHFCINLLVILPLTDGFITRSRLAIEQRPRHRRGCVRMVGEGYMTWLAKRIELAQRPPFVKFTRARITRDFAVLLMRTSYQVLRHPLDAIGL